MVKSLSNDTALYFLLTPEQKKLKYEKNVRKLMRLKKEKITEDDKKDLVEPIQDIVCTKENQCQKYLEDLLKHRWRWRMCPHFCKFI
jgi:hypothetical protein